jgi:hypothetical protein
MSGRKKGLSHESAAAGAKLSLAVADGVIATAEPAPMESRPFYFDEGLLDRRAADAPLNRLIGWRLC